MKKIYQKVLTNLRKKITKQVMDLTTIIDKLNFICENNEDEREEATKMLEEKREQLKKVKNLEIEFTEKAQDLLCQEDNPYNLVRMYKLCQQYDNTTTQEFIKHIPLLCPCCQNILEKKSGMNVCSSCGFFQEVMEKMVPKSNNKNEKTQYDPKDNFKSIVLTFQGKKCKKIPSFVYDKINQSLEKYHFDSYSIKTMKKETLIYILQENKLSDYYEDINILFQYYTNINPPDLSSYEENIFYRNSLVEEQFNELKIDERQNSLNNFFKLYVFLNMEGYNCNPEDFPILKTRNVVVYHNKTMKKICDILKKTHPIMNWNFKPY